MKLKIASITGSRSDYSLMSVLFKKLGSDPEFEHHLLVTGMLLNSDHSDIRQRIQSDQFGILHEIKVESDPGDALTMAMAFGEGIKEMSKALSQIRPDAVLLQGDRGEMLAAAIASAHFNIPIIHLSGGDRSGSIDDYMRNAISKFANIHFTTCLESSSRLKGMGENPTRIFEVGEPGLDVLLNTELIPRKALFEKFELDPTKAFVLACQHPVTSESHKAAAQMIETLSALEEE